MSAALTLVKTSNLTRDEWLKARQCGIGGSDISAITGLNPWRKPIAVYLDKIGEAPEEPESERMYWGSRLEDLIADEFAHRNNLKVQRRNAILQHPEHSWALANIDRLIITKDGNGVLECKTTSAYNKEAWADEQIPEYYMVQLQWYLFVTGLQYGYLAVLIGGQEYKDIRVERNEAMIGALYTIAADFWKLVENRTPPEVDGSESSTETIARLFPASEVLNEIISLPDAAEKLVQDFILAQAREKQATEAKDAAANALKMLLGEHASGTTDKHKISWKPFTSNRVDSKKLKADFPNIYTNCLKSSVSRRFGISDLKGE